MSTITDEALEANAEFAERKGKIYLEALPRDRNMRAIGGIDRNDRFQEAFHFDPRAMIASSFGARPYAR